MENRLGPVTGMLGQDAAKHVIDLESVAGPLDGLAGLAELGQHQRQVRLLHGARWIESDGPLELGGGSRRRAQAHVWHAQISIRLGLLGIHRDGLFQLRRGAAVVPGFR